MLQEQELKVLDPSVVGKGRWESGGVQGGYAEVVPTRKNQWGPLKRNVKDWEVPSKVECSGRPKGKQMLRGGSYGSSLPVGGVESWGSIPPSAVDAFECRGTKRTQE